MAVEDLVRERRQRREHDRRQQPSCDLDHQSGAEQPPQPTPVPRRRVVEPVLDERLLGREIEERLEEAGADDHHGKQAEVLGVELALREHGGQEPETDREIDARRGCGAAEIGTEQ